VLYASVLIVGSIVIAVVLLELFVRLFFASPHPQGKQLLSYTPKHHHDPNNHGADCYPSNPRGYFDKVKPEDWKGALLIETEHYKPVDFGRLSKTPYCAEFHTNSHAHRGADHHKERAPNTFRILAVGDSFIYGEGVKDADTLPNQLQGILQAKHPELAVEVVNLGVPGINTEVEIINHHNHVDLDADVVVLGYVLNDAFRVYAVDSKMQKADDMIMVRPGYMKGSHGWRATLRKISRLYDLIATRAEQREITKLTKAWYSEAFDAKVNPEGLAKTEFMVNKFADDVRATHAKVLVAVYPILYDLGDAYPFANAHKVLEGIMDKHGTPWIDLRDAYAGHSAESLQVHAVDHHPNELAQKLAAQAVAAKLEAMGLVHARPVTAPAADGGIGADGGVAPDAR
jgi:hypothetical protein